MVNHEQAGRTSPCRPRRNHALALALVTAFAGLTFLAGAPPVAAAVAAAAGQTGEGAGNPSTTLGAAVQPAVVAAAAPVPPGVFVTYRVFATQYQSHDTTSVEVAVPDKCAKFAALKNTTALRNQGCPPGYSLDLDYRVVLTLDNGRSEVIPVKDVGPWNVDDNWWNSSSAGSPRPRRMFGDLATGKPESTAAFADGYNRLTNCKDLDEKPTTRTAGSDQFGRCVLNPAGIDLSFEAAKKLGLRADENTFVSVSFLWEPVTPGSKPAIARDNVRYLRQTRNTGRADFNFSYGDPGDVPLTGDWDGNGTRTPGVFRNGSWYLRNSNSTGNGDIALNYGLPTDHPIVGDWNGDGVDTIGIVRDGSWYFRNSNTSGVADAVWPFGDPGDTPVVGDWNGNGTDTFGIVRGGVWYIADYFDAGVAEKVFGYGESYDVPMVGDWDNDGASTPGRLPLRPVVHHQHAGGEQGRFRLPVRRSGRRARPLELSRKRGRVGLDSWP